eukprot:761475-Hanusia_phi.AAC.4
MQFRTKRDTNKQNEPPVNRPSMSQSQAHTGVASQNATTPGQSFTGEWIQKISKTNGLPYFFNVVTGQSAWQLRITGNQEMYYRANPDLAYSTSRIRESGISQPFQPYAFPFMAPDQAFFVNPQAFSYQTSMQVAPEPVQMGSPIKQERSIGAAKTKSKDVNYHSSPQSASVEVAKSTSQQLSGSNGHGPHSTNPAVATSGNQTRMIHPKNSSNGAALQSYRTLQIAKENSKGVVSMLEDGSAQVDQQSLLSRRHR